MNLSSLSIKLVVVSLIFLTSSAFVHIEPPHRGIVRNADTKAPIDGAIVHIDLVSGLYGGAHGRTELEKSYETRTNEKGKYNLSMAVTGRIPLLEWSNGNIISVIKAGYFPSRIIEPSLFNEVELYPIKYYIDFIHYKNSAKKGELDPPYLDKLPKSFVEYKAELLRMGSMKMERKGEESVYLDISGTRLTNLICRSGFNLIGGRKKSSTFGIDTQASCYVFDVISQQWLAFNHQGTLIKPTEAPLSQYMYVSLSQGDLMYYVYANADSIYTPKPPYTNLDKHVTPQKGDISALAGDSNEYLTIQDNGQFLCYFSIWGRIGSGCISIRDVYNLNENESLQLPRFISLAHRYNPAQDHVYFVISRASDYYQIHKVSNEWNSETKKAEFIVLDIFPTLPANEDIINIASNGHDIFIAFAKSGIRKYSLDKHGKGPLKEDIAFHINSSSLLAGRIKSFAIGRSVHVRSLYVTASDSTVYRLSIDGMLDYRIEVKQDIEHNNSME